MSVSIPEIVPSKRVTKRLGLVQAASSLLKTASSVSYPVCRILSAAVSIHKTLLERARREAVLRMKKEAQADSFGGRVGIARRLVFVRRTDRISTQNTRCDS